jgi:hypothetical protein
VTVAERKTAFHAVWTVRNRITNKVGMIDHTLASGPVSTRELAQRICEVEQARKTAQEAQYTDSLRIHTFEVISRPLEASTFRRG